MIHSNFGLLKIFSLALIFPNVDPSLEDKIYNLNIKDQKNSIWGIVSTSVDKWRPLARVLCPEPCVQIL